MGVIVPLIPNGTPVQVRRARWPIDARMTGRTGIVVDASEYSPQRYGVRLEGEEQTRYFRPEELEVTEPLALPPEQAAARKRRALP